jgi:hypothetical protein
MHQNHLDEVLAVRRRALTRTRTRTQYGASVLAIGDVIEYDPGNCNGCFG